MKYIKRIEYEKIKNKYKHIIAWGAGPIFKINYKKNYFELDFIIDGTGKQVGDEYCDIQIKSEEELRKITERTLIIIYTIYEDAVLQQIDKYNNDLIDTIICPLLDIQCNNNVLVPQIYAKNSEDFLILMLCKQLNLESVQFLEIGVCHPVFRNNTYLLNEQFSHCKNYKGVLVEANPLCWNLIEEYRKNDVLVRCGVDKMCGEKDFFAFPDLLGHSTFVEQLAEKEIKCGKKYKLLPVTMKTINDIIQDNFTASPDILSLDIEGLDFEVLRNWDVEKYPFKIIITEIMEYNESDVQNLMTQRGYKMYAKTLENIIWVNNKYKIFV